MPASFESPDVRSSNGNVGRRGVMDSPSTSSVASTSGSTPVVTKRVTRSMVDPDAACFLCSKPVSKKFSQCNRCNSKFHETCLAENGYSVCVCCNPHVLKHRQNAYVGGVADESKYGAPSTTIPANHCKSKSNTSVKSKDAYSVMDPFDDDVEELLDSDGDMEDEQLSNGSLDAEDMALLDTASKDKAVAPGPQQRETPSMANQANSNVVSPSPSPSCRSASASAVTAMPSTGSASKPSFTVPSIYNKDLLLQYVFQKQKQQQQLQQQQQQQKQQQQQQQIYKLNSEEITASSVVQPKNLRADYDKGIEKGKNYFSSSPSVSGSGFVASSAPLVSSCNSDSKVVLNNNSGVKNHILSNTTTPSKPFSKNPALSTSTTTTRNLSSSLGLGSHNGTSERLSLGLKQVPVVESPVTLIYNKSNPGATNFGVVNGNPSSNHPNINHNSNMGLTLRSKRNVGPDPQSMSNTASSNNNSPPVSSENNNSSSTKEFHINRASTASPILSDMRSQQGAAPQRSDQNVPLIQMIKRKPMMSSVFNRSATGFTSNLVRPMRAVNAGFDANTKIPTVARTFTPVNGVLSKSVSSSDTTTNNNNIGAKETVPQTKSLVNAVENGGYFRGMSKTQLMSTLSTLSTDVLRNLGEAARRNMISNNINDDSSRNGYDEDEEDDEDDQGGSKNETGFLNSLQMTRDECINLIIQALEHGQKQSFGNFSGIRGGNSMASSVSASIISNPTILHGTISTGTKLVQPETTNLQELEDNLYNLEKALNVDAEDDFEEEEDCMSNNGNDVSTKIEYDGSTKFGKRRRSPSETIKVEDLLNFSDGEETDISIAESMNSEKLEDDLDRWKKVPIGTFRRSRRLSAPYLMLSKALKMSVFQQKSGGVGVGVAGSLSNGINNSSNANDYNNANIANGLNLNFGSNAAKRNKRELLVNTSLANGNSVFGGNDRMTTKAPPLSASAAVFNSTSLNGSLNGSNSISNPHKSIHSILTPTVSAPYAFVQGSESPILSPMQINNVVQYTYPNNFIVEEDSEIPSRCATPMNHSPLFTSSGHSTSLFYTSPIYVSHLDDDEESYNIGATTTGAGPRLNMEDLSLSPSFF